jgi:hypothetical protein
MYKFKVKYRWKERRANAHKTTPASRRVQAIQIEYSSGPGTFYLNFMPRSAPPQAVLFHGVGDYFFFQGIVGNGAPPFFLNGIVGRGAPPFAMITVPSLWPATTVFRPIAPARTSMARNTTASFRDIVPPGIRKTQVALYPLWG